MYTKPSTSSKFGFKSTHTTIEWVKISLYKIRIWTNIVQNISTDLEENTIQLIKMMNVGKLLIVTKDQINAGTTYFFLVNNFK